MLVKNPGFLLYILMKREIDILSEAFSSQRLKRYMNLYNGDGSKVVAHYKANLALAESLYTSLSVFEVTLRNALSKELERMMGRKDWYSVFPSNPALKSLTSEVTVAIRHISQRGEMVSPDKIVAELTFGFWVTLLNSEYELILWKGLRLAFPHMPKKDRKRKNISSPCNALRKLRNRVFHHESICWDLDYITEIHSRLVMVLGWMNLDIQAWLDEVDSFNEVVDEIRNSSAELKV